MQLARQFRWLTAAVAVGMAVAPHSAGAQGFVDLYFGAGWPESGDVETRADDAIVDDMIRYNDDVDWETTPSFGFRGGYWFQDPGFNFIGIALDLSSYGAFEENDFAELDVWLTPLTPLLMGRIPILASEEFPGGRIQPYAAVGPGFTLSGAEAEIDELRDNFSGLNTRLDDFEAGSLDVGLDARGGITILFTPHFGVFGEYRYTYVEPELEDEVDVCDNIGCFETDIDIEPELRTHHAVFGLTARF